jgi:hypothetical protein
MKIERKAQSHCLGCRKRAPGGGGTPFESEASGDVEEDEEEGEIIFPCALPLENLPLSGHLFGRQIGALARDR